MPSLSDTRRSGTNWQGVDKDLIKEPVERVEWADRLDRELFFVRVWRLVVPHML
jgi:hypothetical protein